MGERGESEIERANTSTSSTRVDRVAAAVRRPRQCEPCRATTTRAARKAGPTHEPSSGQPTATAIRCEHSTSKSWPFCSTQGSDIPYSTIWTDSSPLRPAREASTSPVSSASPTNSWVVCLCAHRCKALTQKWFKQAPLAYSQPVLAAFRGLVMTDDLPLPT